MVTTTTQSIYDQTILYPMSCPRRQCESQKWITVNPLVSPSSRQDDPSNPPSSVPTVPTNLPPFASGPTPVHLGRDWSWVLYPTVKQCLLYIGAGTYSPTHPGRLVKALLVNYLAFSGVMRKARHWNPLPWKQSPRWAFCFYRNHVAPHTRETSKHMEGRGHQQPPARRQEHSAALGLNEETSKRTWSNRSSNLKLKGTQRLPYD